MTWLITGANGFVGRALCPYLRHQGIAVRAAVRDQAAASAAHSLADEVVTVGDIGPSTDWRAALAGVERVIHLAGYAHDLKRAPALAAERHRQVNFLGSKALAEQAARAGIKRLVLVSSIKVNGDQSPPEGFNERQAPHPDGAYGEAKWQAEQALAAIAADTALELTVVRPALVYGPGVKGNVQLLLKAIRKGLPLPLGAVHNRRSLLALDNLCGFLLLAASHPDAAGETYVLADAEPISTTDLIRALAAGAGRPARLLPVPAAVLRWSLGLLGKGDMAERLLGSLVVDSSKARRQLGWRDQLSTVDGLAAVAREPAR